MSRIAFDVAGPENRLLAANPLDYVDMGDADDDSDDETKTAIDTTLH